jgi:hypothetical protein
MSGYRASILIITGLAILFFILKTVERAHAHDPDHHEDDAWYQSIKIPDLGVSCCGVGDAYFCNHMRVVDGTRTVCTITDTRDDASRGRPHVPVGTMVEIPNEKLVRDEEAKKGNPTGQGVIWMKPSMYAPTGYNVYCYMMPELT